MFVQAVRKSSSNRWFNFEFRERYRIQFKIPENFLATGRGGDSGLNILKPEDGSHEYNRSNAAFECTIYTAP